MSKKIMATDREHQNIQRQNQTSQTAILQTTNDYPYPMIDLFKSLATNEIYNS
jgi:hypothetical protein